MGIRRNTSALLTVGGSVVQEVSGHLTLAFNFYNPSTLQLVTFTGQHLVQVCGHLREAKKKSGPDEYFKEYCKKTLMLLVLMVLKGVNGSFKTVRVYLNMVWNPSTVHPTGHVDCVSPDIILGFPGSNNSCNHWPYVQSYKQKIF